MKFKVGDVVKLNYVFPWQRDYYKFEQNEIVKIKQADVASFGVNSKTNPGATVYFEWDQCKNLNSSVIKARLGIK